ncbi:MAG: NAD(P)-dependent oxidoreductase [Chitinophagaceae bacterium]|nr:NAD(P)-dependent oxidoreductase [Chitinophagaceae bacterium]
MKIVVLGADGFVGRNLNEDLAKHFSCYASTRRKETPLSLNYFFFDLGDRTTWSVLSEINPGCIINCIGYGVVKNQADIKQMFDINYFNTVKLYDYLSHKLPNVYIIHIGTAFEYDTSITHLKENSSCIPSTYYGASKYMTSNWLMNKNAIKDYSIIRPFNMFGPYEDASKIIPYLINAQKQKSAVQLTEGLQKRDYFFIKDLSKLVMGLINTPAGKRPDIINAGSGKAITIKDLGGLLSEYIKEFDSSLWNWGKLSYREGESPVFYNKSTVAFDYGMTLTQLGSALELTVNYYWNV